MTRFTFYKINVLLNNKGKYPITIATLNKDNIKELYEKNKKLYTIPNKGLYPMGFEFVEARETKDMTEEAYQEELIHIDIVEETKQEIRTGTPAKSTDLPPWLTE